MKQTLKLGFFQAASVERATAEATTTIAAVAELLSPNAIVDLYREDGATFELGTVQQVSSK